MDPGRTLGPPLPKPDGYFAFVYSGKMFFASMAAIRHAKPSLENAPVTL